MIDEILTTFSRRAARFAAFGGDMISKKTAATVAALLVLVLPVNVLASDVLDVMNTTGYFVAVEIVDASGWRPKVPKILIPSGGHEVRYIPGWPAPNAGVTLKAVVCTTFARTRRDPPAWATDEKIVGEKLVITDEFLRQGPPPAAPKPDNIAEEQEKEEVQRLRDRSKEYSDALDSLLAKGTPADLGAELESFQVLLAKLREETLLEMGTMRKELAEIKPTDSTPATKRLLLEDKIEKLRGELNELGREIVLGGELRDDIQAGKVDFALENFRVIFLKPLPAATLAKTAKPVEPPPGEKNLTEKELGDRVNALKKALDAKNFIGRKPMKEALDEWAKSVKKNGLEFQGWNCQGPILEDYAFQVRTDWNGSRRAHQLAVKRDGRGYYVFSPVAAGY